MLYSGFHWLTKTKVKRVFFNVIHSSNGYLTLIFSIATIFLGMDLALLDLDLWVTQLFSFQVIFIGLIGMTSELFKSKLEGPKNIVLLIFFGIVITILSFIIIGNISRFSFSSWLITLTKFVNLTVIEKSHDYFILYDFAVDIRSLLEPISSLNSTQVVLNFWNIPAETSF